jgi:transposase
MARRQFTVIDIAEVLQHWHAGRPKAVIAASLRIDPKTVRKYVARAEEAGLCAGGPTISRTEWAQLATSWFPELTDPRSRSRTHASIDSHRDRIETMLETNSVTVVHQRLRDEHGLGVGITSFRRYVELEFPERDQLAQVTVLRPEVPPGDEAQVDYGLLGTWFDPVTARRRRVWAFVMVLSFSRHMFVWVTFTMDQHHWTEAHAAAFEYFGGVPARIVVDNLKTGVTTPDLYDPKVNRAYAECAEHYGFLVDPARPVRPKDKPRVERPMRYIRDSFWRGREWGSVAEMRSGAASWCTEVAAQRSHRSLEGSTPMSVFTELEAPVLRACPARRFELARWSQPKVGTDCHVKVGQALYSVPWRLIGRRVDVRWTTRRVEVFVDTQVVKTHATIDRGRATDMGDYPPEKIAFFMRTPAWCRLRAAQVGEATTQLVGELLVPHALHRLRSAQGVLRFADRYGPQALEAACASALAAGDPSYRTVKGVLAAGQDALREVREVPAHLHGPDQLFVRDAS